jgi:FkbM family methyltransferase
MLAAVPGLTYVGFEPDPVAFLALEKNVKGHTLFPLAVSDETGESMLSLETDTADSSLQSLSNPTGGTLRVRTTTLDDALSGLDLGEINVLKVEAEGSEPEVLRGATKTLQRTRICVVDAGPERQGRSTVAESLEILREAGFRLVDMRFPRGALVCIRAD